MMKELIEKAKNTHSLDKNEIISLLSCNDYDEEIFTAADCIREKYVGNEVYLRALIEFSNACLKDCKYCGLRCSNNNIKRYNLDENEILNCVENAVEFGYKTIVLQSGENNAYSVSKLCKLIQKIKEFDVALTLSIGEKSIEEYKSYKAAGADRFLLRIETSDENLYKQMHPKSDYKNRINCLKNLKTLGYEIGTGCLVGLPNQSIESLADDILFFKEIESDMVGIGPFISHPQTPLSCTPNGDLVLAVKVMALTRLLLPNINIPATTAMETLAKNGQLFALQSGANVVMINFTTDDFKNDYNIYPNKSSANPLSIAENLESINRLVKMSRGNSLSWEKKNK
ncbi:[bacterium]|nr:[FeFe] hydrogenase H-cluster radical SAM maturase HydE [bacterium]